MATGLVTNFNLKANLPNFTRDVINTRYTCLDYRPHVHVDRDPRYVTGEFRSIEYKIYEDGHIVYFPNILKDQSNPKLGGTYYRWNARLNASMVYLDGNDSSPIFPESIDSSGNPIPLPAIWTIGSWERFPDGIQSVQGIQGVQGVQGADGILIIIQGTQGIQGIQGIDGIQGTIGIQGTAGLQGTNGAQGADGYNGA